MTLAGFRPIEGLDGEEGEEGTSDGGEDAGELSSPDRHFKF